MKVKLVKLSDEQIEKAKTKNGERKTYTHAVLCGNLGQIFGTEQYCKKYFNAWSKIFPKLFDGGVVQDFHDIDNYETTFDLVNILIAKNDEIVKASSVIALPAIKQKKKSLLQKLFG